MAKKITGYVKLQVPAGKANPAPPIGTALGPKGVNIMDFCKAFNEQTKKMEVGTPIPVVITIYVDRSFTFVMKTPPNTYYLKKHANITMGHKTPGRGGGVGTITHAQIAEIAKEKMRDMNTTDLAAACRMLEGSARSMGLNIEGL